MMDLKLARLLGDVLELQSEPDNEFDDLEFAERVRGAMLAGEDLALDLVSLVWRSPTAREIYITLRREMIDAVREKWIGRGFATEFELKAADSASETETFSAAGIMLHMAFNRASGRWLVNLRLTPEARRELQPGTSVRIADRGGKVWLEGPLDRFGGIDSFWDDPVSPRERAREFGLTFDFI